MTVNLIEILLKKSWTDFLQGADRINSNTRFLDSPRIQIRRKNHHRNAEPLLFQKFDKANSNRISFFSGGTTGHPNPYRVINFMFFNDGRKNQRGQYVIK